MMMSLENLTSTIITTRQVVKKSVFLISFEHLISPGPNITMRSVRKNKTILIHSLQNLSCPGNHELKFSQKYPRFNAVIWKI